VCDERSRRRAWRTNHRRRLLFRLPQDGRERVEFSFPHRAAPARSRAIPASTLRRLSLAPLVRISDINAGKIRRSDSSRLIALDAELLMAKARADPKMKGTVPCHARNSRWGRPQKSVHVVGPPAAQTGKPKDRLPRAVWRRGMAPAPTTQMECHVDRPLVRQPCAVVVPG
jgi:hypothetical protein